MRKFLKKLFTSRGTSTATPVTTPIMTPAKVLEAIKNNQRIMAFNTLNENLPFKLDRFDDCAGMYFITTNDNVRRAASYTENVLIETAMGIIIKDRETGR